MDVSSTSGLNRIQLREHRLGDLEKFAANARYESEGVLSTFSY